jgi:hypothetical protein
VLGFYSLDGFYDVGFDCSLHDVGYVFFFGGFAEGAVEFFSEGFAFFFSVGFFL